MPTLNNTSTLMRWLLVLSTAVLTACSTPALPPNVTTVAAGAHPYLDRVDFSYARASATDFSKLKLCIAETVQNNEANLRDSAGSFVGRYSGTYYQTDNRQTVGGGQVFKYVDDASSTLIASGVTAAPTGGMVLSAEYVRYELKASFSGNQVGLIFSNVTRAQQDTGMLTNTGFKPVGVWPGSRADAVYAALERVATTLKTCLN